MNFFLFIAAITFAAKMDDSTWTLFAVLVSLGIIFDNRLTKG